MTTNADDENKRHSIRVQFLSSTPLNDAWALSALEALLTDLPIILDSILVEDVNLFRFATLPFAKEVSRLTGAESPLAEQQLERLFKQCAIDLENTMKALSQRLKTPHTFNVVRGRMESELSKQLKKADFVIFNQPHPGPAYSPEAEPVIRKLLSEVSKVAFIKPSRSPLTSTAPKVIVVCDGSNGHSHYLVSALNIADKCSADLTVIGSTKQRDSTTLKVEAAITGHRFCVDVQYCWLESINYFDVVKCCNNEQASLLVLPSSIVDPRWLNQVLALLNCSLLIAQ